MNHLVIRHIVRTRNNGLAEFDRRKRAAFLHESRPGSIVNSARHPTAILQFGIGRVDHGLHIGLAR